MSNANPLRWVGAPPSFATGSPWGGRQDALRHLGIKLKSGEVAIARFKGG